MFCQFKGSYGKILVGIWGIMGSCIYSGYKEKLDNGLVSYREDKEHG